MKIYLLNSSMMPQEGKYVTKQISKEEAKDLLLSANELESSIGYEEVANLIFSISGLKVNISRERTVIKESSADILIFTIYNETGLDENLLINYNDKKYVILHSTFSK